MCNFGSGKRPADDLDAPHLPGGAKCDSRAEQHRRLDQTRLGQDKRVVYKSITNTIQFAI